MKLVIELHLPDAPHCVKLARSLRAEYGIYEPGEHADAAAREQLRNARARCTGRPMRKRNFYRPDAVANRRLICESASQLMEICKRAGAHLIEGGQAEIGKGRGGD